MRTWKRQRLGDIISLEYGKPLDASQRKAEGLYPVYGANGEKARTDAYYCDEPTIIVGRKGSVGELTLTEERFWPLDVTYFVKFDRTKHDLRFIYHLLRAQNLPGLAKGVKPGLNRNEAYALPVSMPPPPEQKRIALVLDNGSDWISIAKANAERSLHAYDELEASLLHAALRGEL